MKERTVRGKRASIAIFVICCFLIFRVADLQAAQVQAPEQSNDKRILFISSYSYSWETVPHQIEGITQALSSGYTINYEFMDTKNTTYSEDYVEYYENLSFRLSQRESYDAVIVGDDAALNFVERYKDELFANIPIVFEGIDNIENAAEAAFDPNVTGVVEQVDYEKNLELAVDLFPESKKLVFILDNAENGVGIQNQLKEQADLFADYEVAYINSSEYTKGDFCQKISEIREDSIVFCMSINRVFLDGTYSEEECFQMLTDYSNVPMFRMASAGVGTGTLLGGYIVSHLESGRIAGEMVAQALTEKDVSQIDVNLNSPNKYYFDWQVIEKYGIDTSKLPEGATIINKEQTFIEKYYVQIIAAFAVICFILLVSVIINFIISTKRHRKYERDINVKNQELEIKNEQLSEAIAQADSANSAKSNFLARMSHEIRTPMNAIVGLTTIARQHENEPDKIEDYLVKIDTSSKVLLNIINDVLDMSAIENNKLKIGKTEFDIKQILTGISTIYYPQCEEKGISFEMATNINDEILIGDSLRVNQILLNLVSNAYKFTDKGGTIKINVEEKSRKEDMVFLCFSVADSGCGMSREMLDRLFRPFEQESSDTAKKHGGSGLGLSIAKNLVDLMHGAISVSSEQGVGTTFVVELPFGISETVSYEGDPQAIENLKILVVDDDASAREYTSVVLGRIGVAFDTASTGEEAIEKIEGAVADGEDYDVCLIDWKMPGMDGISLTKKIKEIGSQKSRVVIVSAYDLNEVEDEALDAGADDFIAKPLFQSSIFNILMKLTNGQFVKRVAESETYDFTGHKILLAEDVPLNADIAIELLGMVNMSVDHAEDGEKALKLFAENAPNTYELILLDIQMPIMDGYEAAQAIRALDRADAKEIPIYAMTANAFTEDVSAALAAGMNGHISKPIDTNMLYEVLAKEINGKA